MGTDEGRQVSAERREHLRARLDGYHSPAAVLRGVCELCVAELTISGARIRVLGGTRANGGGALLHSTDELGTRLDDLANTTGTGPCVDAFTSGRPVLVPDLADDGLRWPGFTPDAVRAGAGAVFSFPLQVGAVRLGVLELHRRTTGSLAPAELTDALLLADVATDTIFHDLHGEGPMSLPALVDIQAEVHQATGMVAVTLGVSLPEAFLRLRGHAFARHKSLTEVARDIIERRLRLNPGE
ncbi:hypothetical protein JOF53_000423 [Crossiella equi]|uniref:ANTAR domain-containing protein n=1 Tax=Crossiella equi TaxID=130796 RepID=A0ABS5A4T0_9PSEU|nr:GAF and ANTAR domain-containing protein [Crossiella equi]MBP2471551.1 hypothetical protein [Crossiella equi]